MPRISYAAILAGRDAAPEKPLLVVEQIPPCFVVVEITIHDHSEEWFQKNEAEDNSADGIVVFGSGNRLTDNAVYNSQDSGIEVLGDNNTIIMNTALQSGARDLLDEGTDNIWRHNTYDTASWE